MPFLQDFAKDFINAILDAIRNTFNFSGRTNRKGFLFFALFYLVSLYLLRLLGQQTPLPYWLCLVLLGCPFVSLCIRRLHDVSFSAWWIIAGFILALQIHISGKNLAWLALKQVDVFSASSFQEMRLFFSVADFIKYSLVAFFSFLLLRENVQENRYGEKPIAIYTTNMASTRFQKLLFLIASVLTALGLWGVSHDWVRRPRLQDIVVNFSPGNFREIADQPFYYAIGGDLKYDVSINRDAPTVFKGKDRGDGKLWVWPSPDNRKAIIFNENALYLIDGATPPVVLLEKAASPQGISVGEQFYSSYHLQWDRASRYIYIPRDRKQRVPGAGWFSADAVLERIDTENLSAGPEVWADDFRASKYFLAGDKQVCFNYRQDGHQEKWKCSVEKKTIDMASYASNAITLVDGQRLTEQQFVFNTIANGPMGVELWRKSNGLFVKPIDDRQAGIFLGEKSAQPLIKLKTFKDPYYGEYHGEYWIGTGALPGGRYVFLVIYGRVLLDLTTGQYREIPEDTWVFVNTSNLGASGSAITPGDFRWGRSLPKG